MFSKPKMLPINFFCAYFVYIAKINPQQEITYLSFLKQYLTWILINTVKRRSPRLVSNRVK